MLIDTVNGLTLRYLGLSAGQIVKLPLTVYMVVYLLLEKDRNASIVMWLVSIYFLILLIQFSFHNNLSYLFNDIVHFNKGVLPLITYLFFIKLGSSLNLEKLAKKIILTNFVIIAINFTLGLFGLGYYQYASLEIGTRGFFYAGNEVSGVMIVIFIFVLFFSLQKSKMKFFIVAALVVFLSILKATKTAIISSVLIVILVPFSLEQGRLTRLTKFKVNVFLSILISFPLLSYLIYFGVERVGLLERLTYFSSRYDVVTFLLSSRNKDVIFSLNNYLNDYSWPEKIFGIGQSVFSNTFYQGLRNSVEIDIFDTLFFYGFFGIFIFSIIWMYFLLNSLSKINNADYPYAFPAFLSNLLLILSSLTAGHIFYSGMIGIFVGLSNSLVHLKSEKWQD